MHHIGSWCPERNSIGQLLFSHPLSRGRHTCLVYKYQLPCLHLQQSVLSELFNAWIKVNVFCKYTLSYLNVFVCCSSVVTTLWSGEMEWANFLMEKLQFSLSNLIFYIVSSKVAANLLWRFLFWEANYCCKGFLSKLSEIEYPYIGDNININIRGFVGNFLEQ